MEITLPSGAVADLMSPDTLKAKHVRAMTRAISDMSNDQRVGSVVVDLTDGAIAIVVQSWTCVGDDGQVLPIPSVAIASLEELTAFDYYALLNHEYVTEVNRKFLELRSERDNPDDFADPASPTAPSDGSGPVSRVEPSPPVASATPAGMTPLTISGGPSDGVGLLG